MNTLAGRTRRRVAWRILPFAVLLYVVAFIDRVNVSYAKLHMADDLGFSDAVYGFGAGIFFIGYVLLEIPGSLLVERWSARLWISRIMISWGVLAVVMGFIHTKAQFYSVRFLLGAAEAGFFPGLIVYLSHWFRREDRAKAVAMFMAGMPIASLLGAPLSGWVMEHIAWAGLAGWRWVFILEGVPSIVLGVVVVFYLTDWPHQARWLPKDERAWLEAELAREKAEAGAVPAHDYWAALRQPAVLLLAGIYFCAITGLYGFNMWLPTLVKKVSGLGTMQVTLVAALPYVLALVAMLFAGWSSDRSRERIWHSAVPLLIGGVAFGASVLAADHFPLAMAALCVAGAGIHAFLPSFWALPSSLLRGAAAAVAVGLINSFGNLGGFVGPYVFGWLREFAPGSPAGLLFLGAMLLAAAGLLLVLGKTTRVR